MAMIVLEGTAVSLPEEQVREVLALDGILLAGTPQDRGATERLTARPVDRRRVGNWIRHLRFVFPLVHDRLEVRSAQCRSAVITPGDQLPVHFRGETLGDEHGTLHATDVDRQISIHRVDASLTAGTPEE